MILSQIAASQAALRKTNSLWPVHLTTVPRQDWPAHNLDDGLADVLRSRNFLVQIYLEPGALRMSVCRTQLDALGRWRDGITWDELMQLKAEAGYADEWAVELYPPAAEIVNVANFRHLWILPGAPEYGWNSKRSSCTGSL